jgi:hypothetical protein
MTYTLGLGKGISEKISGFRKSQVGYIPARSRERDWDFFAVYFLWKLLSLHLMEL